MYAQKIARFFEQDREHLSGAFLAAWVALG